MCARLCTVRAWSNTFVTAQTVCADASCETKLRNLECISCGADGCYECLYVCPDCDYAKCLRVECSSEEERYEGQVTCECSTATEKTAEMRPRQPPTVSAVVAEAAAAAVV